MRKPSYQGNRISKQSQKAVEVGIVPSGPLELSAQRAFGSLPLHGIERHMTEDGEVVWSIAQSSSRPCHSLQSGPMMFLLEPIDRGGNGRRAGLDPSVIDYSPAKHYQTPALPAKINSVPQSRLL
jgi:hypothetical protein